MVDEAEQDADQEEHHGSVQSGEKLQDTSYSIAYDIVTQERNYGGATELYHQILYAQWCNSLDVIPSISSDFKSMVEYEEV
ncbi:hypothetical protein L2E82_00599 [Cichorium intybus]|uniref:Uncharacterized protein n=1 Tax=Cichorium intybus TaxID=13427 RepID=A0ACB9GY55_CICIN|nr:hypothetical protein L2E82_00599 [Cichorium intybus]